MREAEDVEINVQESFDGRSRLRRIVMEAQRDEVEGAACVVREEVGAEENARFRAEQEREVHFLGTRRVEGDEAAGELLPDPVALVRLLLSRPGACRCPHARAELAAVAPCRALMALRREAYGNHGLERCERLCGEPDGVDEDGVPIFAPHGMRRALCPADALVEDEPAPDAGDDLLCALGDGGRLGHDVNYRCRVQHVTHWDDVEPYRREVGHLAATWTDLGTAAGTAGAGLKRIQVDPGKWSTPAHSEGAEEEIFFVLAGSGLSWQDDGQGPAAYPVGAGDCLVHLAEREAHTLRAGPDGLDVLVFGQRIPQGNTVLPRAGVAWMGSSWVEIGGDHPWQREAAAGEPEVGELMERPANIVNAADGGRHEIRPGALDLDLGTPAGSARSGISQVVLDPGKDGYPLHCHSAEEEIFVVLKGSGTLFLGDEEAPVRAGHVVGRPAGSRIAHAFRAGDEGMTYLAYGTREPNDIAYFPRSEKIFFRGVGVMARVEGLDYWDGESKD